MTKWRDAVHSKLNQLGYWHGTLYVLDYSTDRLLGKIDVDIVRSERLLHFPGIHGWRAYECLTKKERAELRLKSDQAIMFRR